MPSPPPFALLHESFTSGTEVHFRLKSHFVLHVMFFHSLDFYLLIYVRFRRKSERDYTLAKEEEGGTWGLDDGGVVKTLTGFEILVTFIFFFFLELP